MANAEGEELARHIGLGGRLLLQMGSHLGSIRAIRAIRAAKIRQGD
jgi:hypothetical protein